MKACESRLREAIGMHLDTAARCYAGEELLFEKYANATRGVLALSVGPDTESKCFQVRYSPEYFGYRGLDVMARDAAEYFAGRKISEFMP